MLPATKKDAIMESIKIFNCATEPPIIPGTINLKTFFTPSCLNSRLRLKRNPNLRTLKYCNKSCNTPPIKTPIAKLNMGTEISGLKKIAAEIIDIFNKAGVKAAMANFPKTLRILAKSAVREIKTRYGKVIFNNATDKRYLSESRSKPGAKISITKGDISIPIVTTTPKIIAKVPNCALRKLFNLFRSCFSLYSVKTGINAFEKAYVDHVWL